MFKDVFCMVATSYKYTVIFFKYLLQYYVDRTLNLHYPESLDFTGYFLNMDENTVFIETSCTISKFEDFLNILGAWAHVCCRLSKSSPTC